MKPYELEHWVLSIIDRVDAHQPVEDFRVELKGDWPDPKRIARWIAGHANAARGEPILWLIGVDEKAGVRGASLTEFSNWYAQVAADFDGIPPDVVSLNVPVGDRTIVALLFDTTRAPFVVGNLDRKANGKGQVEREVPWREGTATRSATRSQLLKVLVPLQSLPDIEILGGRLVVSGGGKAKSQDGNEENVIWRLDLELYLVPHGEARLVIPFHRCNATLIISDAAPAVQFSDLRLAPRYPPSFPYVVRSDAPHPRAQPDSLTINGTQSEVIADGPGLVVFAASALTRGPIDLQAVQPSVSVVINPIGVQWPVLVEMGFESSQANTYERAAWSVKGSVASVLHAEQ